MTNIPTIPEGKELIWSEATYKEPIEGIPFSNTGITLGRAKYVDAKDAEKEKELLDEETERTVKRYFKKIAKDVKETRNELIDKLRIEFDEKYKAHIQELKDEILKLKNK